VSRRGYDALFGFEHIAVDACSSATIRAWIVKPMRLLRLRIDSDAQRMQVEDVRVDGASVLHGKVRRPRKYQEDEDTSAAVQEWDDGGILAGSLFEDDTVDPFDVVLTKGQLVEIDIFNMSSRDLYLHGCGLGRAMAAFAPRDAGLVVLGMLTQRLAAAGSLTEEERGALVGLQAWLSSLTDAPPFTLDAHPNLVVTHAIERGEEALQCALEAWNRVMDAEEVLSTKGETIVERQAACRGVGSARVTMSVLKGLLLARGLS
jgi:hypothetical protein